MKSFVSLVFAIVILAACHDNSVKPAPESAIEQQAVQTETNPKNKNSDSTVTPGSVPQSEFDNPKNYAPFAKLDIAPAMHKRFKEDLPGIAGVFVIDAEIIPLGWSSDGRKFAYAIEPADEACGCYLVHVVIQDLVSDKTLWEKRTDEASNADWSVFWQVNETELTTAFDDHGINATHPGQFKTGNSLKNIRFSVNKTEGTSPDWGETVGVLSHSIIAHNTDGKVKTIHQDSIEYPFMYDLEVMGVILGPDPERVAVVVGQVWRGWEGPPNVTRFKIIGAHTAIGFK